MTGARALAACLAAAATAALGRAAAPSAGALTVLTCGGSETATYSPALTNTPQPIAVTIEDRYGPCVNLLNPLELRTGTVSLSFPPTLRSCTDLLSSRAGSRTIHWSTGTTSTFSFTAMPNYVAGGLQQVTLTGSITAGEFQGATAVGVVLVASGALTACDSTGVPSFEGVTSLAIAQ